MTVQINKIVLERVNKIKYLGVIFDNKLSFHSHTQYVLNKMSQKVYLLSRIGKNLNIYTRRLLYRVRLLKLYIRISFLMIN
jgi:hypothetical protein